MKIAICDDEELLCSKIEKIILEYGEANNICLEIDILNDGQELLKLMAGGEYFDLIFLDIEMRYVNGIETGKIIREKMKDEITKIVYISGSDNYAMELFQVRPLDFLIKPISKEKVVWAINKTIELTSNSEDMFEFTYNKSLLRTPIKDILYFMSEARKVKVVTEDGYKEFYGKLSDVELQVKSNFIRVHESYIVNAYYITEYSYKRVKLSNGEIFNITRKYRNIIREKLMKGAIFQ
ncbi:MAG: response regulator transcription factor [Clostridiales bacterium]|nr:response regulator transcription factor [Clostridiales bacterium]